mgnify:CR=1 FL=1
MATLDARVTRLEGAGRAPVSALTAGQRVHLAGELRALLAAVPHEDDRIALLRRLDALGMNRGSTGNLSLRSGDGMLITPTGMGGDELRPQDLGVLAGIGITTLPVHRRPRVAIISTGDELVPPDQQPGPGKIRDINSTTLAALVEECGGEAIALGITSDSLAELTDACRRALALPADVVLLSGGSSVGRRDFTLAVFERLEGTEVLAHGVSIRPGKPTILARRENVAFIGLPGHVGSAIVVFHLLVRPLLRRLAGSATTPGLRRIRAVTSEQIPSVIGREDYVRVTLHQEDIQSRIIATPVYGKSGLLNPLVRADGLLVIHRDTEGLDQGEEAEVLLFP